MAEPSKWRRPWRIAVGTTVVVGVAASIVALTAPSESPTAEPPAPTPTEPERPAPVLRPLALAPEPIWTSEDSGADEAVVRDGVALVLGQQHLTVLDLASGAVRWSLEGGEELDGGAGDSSWAPTGHAPAQLVATEAGLTVPVEYDRPGRDEAGLALLSAEDGEVVWQHETGSAEEVRRVLWAADDRVALLSVASEGLSTIAVDLGTGEEVWNAPDVWPAAIVGDAALVVSSAESLADPRGAVRMPDGALSARNLVTGEPRWDLGDRFEKSEVTLTAGDVVLVRAGEEDVLVDAAGEVLGVLGEQRGCTTDGSTLIACPVDHSGMRVFDLTTREITTATLEGEFASLDSVVAGRVIMVDTDGTFFSADPFGNRIDESLPTGAAAACDTHVLFHTKRAQAPVDVISLHPLTV